MTEHPEYWKDRYLLAIETQESQRSEHQELVAQLSRAVTRVSLACEGLDPTLDSELAGLRAFLRLGKGVSTPVLGSKIDVVEELLRVLDKQRKQQHTETQEQFKRLIRQLNYEGAPRELGRRINAFESHAAQRLGAKPEFSPEILRSYAELLCEALLSLRTPLAKKPGLIDRLFGQKTPSTVPPLAPDHDIQFERAASSRAETADVSAAETSQSPEQAASAQDLTSDFEAYSRPATRALDSLIDTVEAPLSDNDFRAIYELAKQRLAGGIRVQQLVSSIEDIRVLTAAALARNQDEFEEFLQQLNQRLTATSTAASNARSAADQRAEASAQLKNSMQSGMENIRHSVATATEIEQLKSEVRSRIDSMTSAIEDYKKRDLHLQVEFSAQIESLQQRVQDLDSELHGAEARVTEQRQLAITDRLTQLPNREAYAQRLTEEFERWKRYGRPLSLAVCDIDHFKQVNDTYGHAAGDLVIRSIGDQLRGQLRESDFVARYGGEEFVMLLIETDATQGAQALEGIRETLQNCSIEHDGKRIAVTGSFGIAQFQEGDAPDRVFARADAALYEAKQGGRNRVRIYGADAEGPA